MVAPLALFLASLAGGSLMERNSNKKRQEAEKQDQAMVDRNLDLAINNDMVKSNGINLDVSGLQAPMQFQRRTAGGPGDMGRVEKFANTTLPINAQSAPRLSPEQRQIGALQNMSRMKGLTPAQGAVNAFATTKLLAPKPPTEMVNVKGPDGKVQMVPKEILSMLPSGFAQTGNVSADAPQPREPRYATAQDGSVRWLDGPNAGQRAFPDAAQPAPKRDIKTLYNAQGVQGNYDVSDPNTQDLMLGNQLFSSNPVQARELTPGQEAIDKKFADTYVSWSTGGSADTKKQLSQLDGAIKQLESGQNLSGAGIGMVPEGLKPLLIPDALALQESVFEVVQRNLREILGAQFTQKEGEMLISRAYNSSLKEEENVKRLNLLVTQMKEAADAKDSASKYFEENGTLKGWAGGQLYNSGGQFISEFENRLNAGSASNSPPDGITPEEWAEMSPEDQALFL